MNWKRQVEPKTKRPPLRVANLEYVALRCERCHGNSRAQWWQVKAEVNGKQITKNVCRECLEKYHQEQQNTAPAGKVEG